MCQLVSSNALTAMLTVYSAECFSTNNRGKGTGFISASTKVAGVVAPYFITNFITYGYLWQISVIVGVPLICGAAVFGVYAKNTHTFEPDQGGGLDGGGDEDGCNDAGVGGSGWWGGPADAEGMLLGGGGGGGRGAE